MRTLQILGGVAVLVASAAVLPAADLESGIEVDGKIGAYRTIKVAGCDDGVKEGKSLCYT